MKKRKAASLLVILGLGILTAAFWPRKSQYEAQIDKITEIDYDKRQQELDAVVEKGKMNVNYMSHTTFQGKTSQKFNVKNIKNNHYPIVFQIYDEKETCIYTSPKIEPGYEMSRIELETELPKGIHECKLQIGYAEEGNVSSAFPITIEVK
jgi:hypothetical protein